MAGCGTKIHYLKGKPFKGAVHKMPNGECHTGKTHTKNSVKLAHKKPKK